jgi:glycosyltransferase involved in cell wall biosynthesis
MSEAATPEQEALVDIAIPAFRRPRFLVEAIESIVAQTFERWRLIISEDGPSAGSDVEAAIQPYLADPRISYRAHPHNVGIIENKNGLLRETRAPYVAVLDDDDRWDAEFLERRIAFFEKRPECGFVFSGYTEIDEDGNAIRQSGPIASEGMLESADFVPRLLSSNFVRTPTALIRSSAFETVGMFFDARFPGIYDWEAWIRLSMRFPVGFLDARDAGYRVHRVQETFRSRNGEQVLHLLDHARAHAGRTSFDIRLSERQWRDLLAFWSVSASLDALERGERRTGLSRLTRAGRLAPRSLFDRRAAAAAGGILLGRRAGRFVAGPLRNLVRGWRRARMRSRGT